MLVPGEAGHAGPGSLKGIAAMVAATALFTCGDAAMKLVSSSLPTGETVFVRGVCTVMIVTLAAFWTGAIYRLRDAFVRVMGWRSLGDVGGALFFQAALARSAFNAWALLGVLAVLSGTLRDVSTRRLDVALSPLLIMMLSQIVVASGGLGCWAFETWKVPSRGELFSLAFASVFSLVGHLCVIYSLRSGEVAAVAPFRYAGIVWAILLGFLIWNQLPDALSLAGILILASAGLYTFYREQQLRRQRAIQLASRASPSA